MPRYLNTWLEPLKDSQFTSMIKLNFQAKQVRHDTEFTSGPGISRASSHWVRGRGRGRTRLWPSPPCQPPPTPPPHTPTCSYLQPRLPMLPPLCKLLHCLKCSFSTYLSFLSGKLQFILQDSAQLLSSKPSAILLGAALPLWPQTYTNETSLLLHCNEAFSFFLNNPASRQKSLGSCTENSFGMFDNGASMHTAPHIQTYTTIKSSEEREVLLSNVTE